MLSWLLLVLKLDLIARLPMTVIPVSAIALEKALCFFFMERRAWVSSNHPAVGWYYLMLRTGTVIDWALELSRAQNGTEWEVIKLGNPKPARALTGVRGLAAWWVVVYHFREYLPAWTPAPLVHVADHGNLAVDLFFILSGYVISANYSPLFKGGIQSRNYLVFLGLRLSRIYPLHVLLLVLFLLLGLAVGALSTHPSRLSQDWGYLFLSFGLVQSWDLTGVASWNVPAWSVSTEWLAYLLFPLLARSAIGQISGPRRLAAGLLTGASIFAGISIVAGAKDLGWMNPAYCLLRCFGEFSLGVLVSSLAASGLTKWGRVLCCILLSIPFLIQQVFLLPNFVGVPALFCGVVLLLSADDQGWSGFLRSNLLQTLGNASYATYISHYFLKVVTKLLLVRPGVPIDIVFPAYCVLVLVATMFLFRVVEQPCQTHLRRMIRGKAGIADGLRPAEA